MQVLLHGKWAKKCENQPILGEMYGIQDWYALFQMHLCLNTLDTAVLPNIDMSSL